ncbi:MAG: ABC transporter ATP-binding protein [Candidatus Comchoanobacterales bacterium]
MTIIAAKNICHQLGEQIIPRKPLSFDLEAGDCLLLRGGNGVGKTTIMRIVLGQLAYCGTLHYQWPSHSVVHHMMAVFAHDLLPQSMRVSDFIKLHQRLYDLPSLFVHQVSNQLGGEYCQQIIGTLSQGYQMRLKLLLVQCITSHVWILDEPWTYIDQQIKIQLNESIDAFRQAGGVVICSSHDPGCYSGITKELVL